MTSDEKGHGAAPDSLFQRVKARLTTLTPWNHRTRKAERADAETSAIIASADQAHVAARSAIQDALAATRASYRAADERIRRVR